MPSRSTGKFWAGVSAAVLAIGAFILNQAMGEGFKYGFGKLLETYGLEAYLFWAFVIIVTIAAILLAYNKLPEDRSHLALVFGLVAVQLVFVAQYILQGARIDYVDWSAVVFVVGAIPCLIWLFRAPGIAPLVALIGLELIYRGTFFAFAAPAIAYAIWAYWSGKWKPAAELRPTA